MTSEYRLGAWALTWRYLLAFCWVPLWLAVLLMEQDLPREPSPAFRGFLIPEILGVIAALVLIRFRRRDVVWWSAVTIWMRWPPLPIALSW